MAGAIDRIFHPAIERVARTRYEPAREVVAGLQLKYRPGNADELIKLIAKRYTRELAAVSALAGGAAAIPGAGTGTVLASSTVDLAYSITKMGEMILAIGIAAGHDAESLEQRRSWVVSVLTMANGAAAGLEGVAGRIGSAGGASLVGRIPRREPVVDQRQAERPGADQVRYRARSASPRPPGAFRDRRRHRRRRVGVDYPIDRQGGTQVL